MINRKMKILLWFGGVLSACTVPIITTISCDGNVDYRTDQQKMSDINSKMILDFFGVKPNIHVFPSLTTAPKTTYNATINDLAGVTITVSNVIADNYAGTLTATAAISKGKLIPPKGNPFTFKWTGFRKLTPQEKMTGITEEMIKKAFNITPNTNTWSDEIKKTADKMVTINDLSGVAIHINNWVPNIAAGSLSASVSVSKTGLTPPPGSPFTITWHGFKRSTSFKFNQIAEGPTGDDIGPNSSIVKIDGKTLFVCTNNKGFYWVNISQSPWAWTKVDNSNLPDLSSGGASIKLIAPHKCLIGTFNKGYFLLDTISKEITKVTPPTSTGITPESSGNSPIVILNFGKNILVWTNNKGLFNVDISTNNWKWTKVTNSNINDDSGSYSNIIHVDSTHLLVAASQIASSADNSSFFKVDTSTQPWKWTKINDPNLDTHSAIGASIIKVDDNTLLVGTYDRGFYKVSTIASSWVWTKIDNYTTHLTNESSRYSSSFLIDKHTILVGTYDKGFYKVSTITSSWVWIQVGSNLTLLSGYKSSITRIDNNTLIVGTSDRRFQKVVIS